ncbi:helix-turn-helix domain-containing protein, partial [Streptomyces sp. NPDC005921]
MDVATGALPRGLGLVERVVRGELDSRGGPGVVRLAEESGLDKGQASRLLRDLVDTGAAPTTCPRGGKAGWTGSGRHVEEA